MLNLKTPVELQKMRDAGRIVAETLRLLEESVRVGISTAELDALAEAYITKCGATPTFKGYSGYPASICASINEEIVHGIPRPDRILQDGDIVSIDVGATFRGYVGDAARTFPVGDVSAEAKDLMRVTQESFFKGFEQAVVGNRLGDVCHAVQKHVERHGFSVIRDLVGHGVGKQMHEDPNVPNYGKAGRGPRLEAGLTIAVEPMVAVGHYSIRQLPDHWTCVTRDGSLASHYENTLAVTADGPQILTAL